MLSTIFTTNCRFVDKDYMDDEMSTFLIEIPLSEVMEWDGMGYGIRGKDLADRVILTVNTWRYHALICSLIDDLLQTHFRRSNTNSNTNNPNQQTNHSTRTVLLRQVMDILPDQQVVLHITPTGITTTTTK
jgi:hypothetical protein